MLQCRAKTEKAAPSPALLREDRTARCRDEPVRLKPPGSDIPNGGSGGASSEARSHRPSAFHAFGWGARSAARQSAGARGTEYESARKRERGHGEPGNNDPRDSGRVDTFSKLSTPPLQRRPPSLIRLFYSTLRRRPPRMNHVLSTPRIGDPRFAVLPLGPYAPIVTAALSPPLRGRGRPAGSGH